MFQNFFHCCIWHSDPLNLTTQPQPFGGNYDEEVAEDPNRMVRGGFFSSGASPDFVPEESHQKINHL
jgi:hypothetical protein